MEKDDNRMIVIPVKTGIYYFIRGKLVLIVKVEQSEELPLVVHSDGLNFTF